MSQLDTVEISGDHLPTLDDVTALVQDDGAGAITTFSGTTRNVFEGSHTYNIPYFFFNT